MSHEVMDLEHVDREQLLQVLRERTAKLESIEKEFEQFAHSVSHDLRAPLRALEGFAHIVLEDYGQKLDPEGKRCLEIIATSSKRASQLIEDLLTLSRLGRQELKPGVVNMQMLVHKIIEEIQTEVGKRRVEFLVRSLPDAWGDERLLTHVWSHLLRNAIKFTRPRERGVIEINGRSEDREVIYSVKDNGVGFDMKYVNRLFGIFQRLHSDNDFEGHGVGLAIVQRLVHRHGGLAWAEGKVNDGAKFSFSLPSSEGPHERNFFNTELSRV